MYNYYLSTQRLYISLWPIPSIRKKIQCLN